MIMVYIMVRNGKYYKLAPSLSEDLDKRVLELEKKALLIRKIHNIMNIVKANGLYSDGELQKECDRLDINNCPGDERRIILKAWKVRKKLCLDVLSDCESLLDDIEGYYGG